MTLDEVSQLQIGDKLQLPTGAVATVQSVNTSYSLVALSMLGGITSGSIPGAEEPPERQDVDTQIICPWADLFTATKIPPEAAATMGVPEGKTAPIELPLPSGPPPAPMKVTPAATGG